MRDPGGPRSLPYRVIVCVSVLMGTYSVMGTEVSTGSIPERQSLFQRLAASLSCHYYANTI